MERAVLDTNVVVSAETTTGQNTAPQEILERWRHRVVDLLVSDDILLEYTRVLRERGVSVADVTELIGGFAGAATLVTIDFFHLRYYPEDPDDIAFLLCAINGEATHIVSRDAHLLDIDYRYQDLRICRPGEFLGNLRQRIADLVETALDRGVITRDAGNWHHFEEINLGQQRDTLLKRLGTEGTVLHRVLVAVEKTEKSPGSTLS